MTPGRFAKRVTEETLPLYEALLRRGRPERHGDASAADEIEATSEEANVGVEDHPGIAEAEARFAGEAVGTKIPFRRPRRAVPSPGGRSGVTLSGPASAVPAAAPRGRRGTLLWRRDNLPASSVQRQPGNPTGGLRLVQARYRDASGRLINQTTYFRKVAFRELHWQVGSRRPYREDAEAEFAVSVRGRDMGVHKLKISHKPSGEAGQGNYTTILHWGVLGSEIQRLNLVGRSVEIYAPAATGAPYSVVVN